MIELFSQTKAKKITDDAINPIYSVYICESVNLDDGDSAIVESPFLFLILFLILFFKHFVILSVVEGSFHLVDPEIY